MWVGQVLHEFHKVGLRHERVAGFWDLVGARCVMVIQIPPSSPSRPLKISSGRTCRWSLDKPVRRCIVVANLFGAWRLRSGNLGREVHGAVVFTIHRQLQTVDLPDKFMAKPSPAWIAGSADQQAVLNTGLVLEASGVRYGIQPGSRMVVVSGAGCTQKIQFSLPRVLPSTSLGSARIDEAAPSGPDSSA